MPLVIVLHFVSRGQMKFETGKEVLMGLLPFYHIYGMMVLQFGTLAQGAKLIIHRKFEPATFLQSVQDHEVREDSIIHGHFNYSMLAS